MTSGCSAGTCTGSGAQELKTLRRSSFFIMVMKEVILATVSYSSRFSLNVTLAFLTMVAS